MAEQKETSGRGGRREGAGRKKIGEEKRDRNIGIRVSESELQMFKDKAEVAGMKLTEYIIHLVKTN